MTFGDKLSTLRKQNNYTQEQLADLLGVSRQSVSKWEGGIAYPETEKLIRLSELFHCSLDALLKDGQDLQPGEQGPFTRSVSPWRLRERKSERTVWGMPLWHIGRNARGFVAVGLNARGFVAVGLNARGVVSLGLLAIGAVSMGLLSLGLIAIGTLALGLMSAGSISVGLVATGAISLGVVSLGSVAVGDFSVGAVAIGRYFALGDKARAMIALGDSEAMGTVFQRVGELSQRDVAAVRQALDEVVPAYLRWAKGIIRLFL